MNYEAKYKRLKAAVDALGLNEDDFMDGSRRGCELCGGKNNHHMEVCEVLILRAVLAESDE